MANAVGAGVSNGRESGEGGGGPGGGRSPRWTRQEILVLIKGKRAVESRGRVRGRGGGGVGGGGEVGTVEPKWASVSSYCRRHGVNRGAVQCRKRWSNLAGDFKKIKVWEASGKESFWTMRNDLRRERKLPGFFHREVYDILDGADLPESEAEVEPAAEEDDGKKGDGLTPPLDSRPTETEDGSFSEEEKEAEEEEEDDPSPPPQPVAAVPISEKNCESSGQERTDSDEAMATDKQHAQNPEKGSPSHEGHKRRRISPEGDEDDDLQTRLIKILDQNSRMLTAQLEVQNLNFQLDRDERKDQTNGLLIVFDKLADALGKIADKL
ncbi:trihelix transcription factor ASR3-like [Zingiber officinale]|uniref:Myb-like domain-containing protein n=1 Tax=Zingiber officinale TaxID=94328 RepID=A0A8J5LJH1_ZINOF|nr:trihelix transcription factor ASR3-like [Zingiber officinale]KAG6527461.1 hypothetical protein ZIOFF_009563 [Zingiber officinale]